MLRVSCVLAHCAYYRAIEGPEKYTHCDCAHPEKHLHKDVKICPLYRLDWTKTDNGASKALALLRAKRGLK